MLAAATLLGVAALLACRDALAPYTPPATEWPGDSTGVLLTYNTFDDRGPTWSTEGDTIYYYTRNHSSVPLSPGLLVAMPMNGGVSKPIIANRQLALPQPRWLTTANISPSKDRLAYVELTEVAELPTCFSSCSVPRLPHPLVQPRLVVALLRVTNVEPAITDNDARVAITFDGRRFDTSHPQEGLLGTWQLTAHPFQRRFSRLGTPVFRPSWSPDGNRLVYSDGLRLYTWTVGSSAPIPLPGTQDGILPAWSPDGQWIAFTRPLRSDSLITNCNCFSSTGAVAEVQRRVIFNDDSIGDGALMVVRPDGSNLRVIGIGDAPVWTRDGQLVFRRDDALWRSNPDGTNALRIAHTQGAWEPSVSPDDKHVAFVRLDESGDWDVWVVPIKLEAPGL